jgi:hypothetical protein
MYNINYNTETKTFSNLPTKTIGGLSIKDIVKIAGVSAVLQLIPIGIKIISKKYGNKKKDEILYNRNNRLNKLSDNYKTGKAPEVNEASIKKYREELHKLLEDTLYLEQTKRKGPEKNPDINITVNQDQYGGTRSVSRTPVDRDTIMGRYIAPFIVLLKLVCIKGIHILAGSTLGADRRNFELVYNPMELNPDNVARDPYRTVIFKHNWPSHGFETTSIGHQEANELINDCIEFLAHNPKYLSIRI